MPRRIVIGITAALVLAFGWFAYCVFDTWRNIPEAYAAWDTGVLIVAYLALHDNKWPHSWDELLSVTEDGVGTRGDYGENGINGILSDSVSVDWDFDPTSIVGTEWVEGQIRVVTRADGRDFSVLWPGADPNQMIWRYLNKPPPDSLSRSGTSTEDPTPAKPNIVFCMADDWSWPHAGILGDPVVKTPNFDRIAAEGVLFENAFVSTPSCTPSRLSILTGQHHWRLQEGDSLGGSLREEYDVYTEMLQKAGYRIGRFGKGVWPSKHTFRKRDSFGEKFRSFAEFIKNRNPDEPFCYWHGGQDPHRPYELGVGVKSGIHLSDINVPGCLPDSEAVRSDIADYLWEVQRFDREVGQIIEQLTAMGELENTIIVVSGDNGMPFPRCKATLYDQGTRVPLAIRWGGEVDARRKVTDFVSLCDMAPTFLEAAGLKPSKQMTGRSLIPLLKSASSGQLDPTRTFALSGMEKHVYSYPSRALRTKDFLYIRNLSSEKWPTGEVEGHNPRYDFATTPWPTESGAFSFNIDPSPSKQYLRLHRNEEDTRRFADLSFSEHLAEELYDLHKDPEQLANVAGQLDYAKIRQRLRQQLDAELIRSDDPRLSVNQTSRASKAKSTSGNR